jgi:hypothetical protein
VRREYSLRTKKTFEVFLHNQPHARSHRLDDQMAWSPLVYPLASIGVSIVCHSLRLGARTVATRTFVATLGFRLVHRLARSLLPGSLDIEVVSANLTLGGRVQKSSKLLVFSACYKNHSSSLRRLGQPFTYICLSHLHY